MKTHLDFVYEHETQIPDRPWLTQPMGGGALEEYTWKRGMDEARRMAAHLGTLGFAPKTKIAIFAKNNAWWLISDLAIWMAGHVSVPVYPTLAAGSIKQILEHSEAKLVIVGKLDGFKLMEPGLPAELPRIAMPLAPAELKNATPWREIIAKTAPLTGTPRRALDDLATIIYTSGSTGVPKGVMHSFRTMAAAQRFTDLTSLKLDDRLISYLPLAHVAERAVLQTTNCQVGYHVYFAEALDTFNVDVRRAQPTVFGSVPRLWLKFQSGVYAKMPPKKLARMLKIPILSRIVKKKVLDALGLYNVRWAVTGSAPTPKELVAFYTELGLNMYEMYGMTENFAVSHSALPGQVRSGYIGTPLPGVEQKIGPNDEVLVKSPGTMLGYYKADALTKETIDAEGFLHTGDRGEIDSEGRLKITGRVKEQFKTSKGKYVAPAPIENRLLAYPDLEQACVSGADMAQPYALVVLAEHIRKSDRVKSERAAIGKALEAYVAKLNQELDPHEQLEKVVVMADEWTVDNGLLTPTLKLKRAAIEARYAPNVPAWYAQKDHVIWA
ncbi:MAG: AMP-binding protein [Deltaproteobacteria bacterium]|nr:AMP-binding protein [Deltaproteobacteria bacterium]